MLTSNNYLRPNDLSGKSGEELAAILNAIPKSVKCIDIEGNDLTASQIEKILCENLERELTGDLQLQKMNEEFRLYIFKTLLTQGELISPNVANIIMSYLSPLGENMPPFKEGDIVVGEVNKKFSAGFWQPANQKAKRAIDNDLEGHD